MKTKILIHLAVLAFSCTQALAAAPLTPGRYITEHEWGSLEIKRPAPSAPLKFEIFALGSNAHTCTIEGEIKNNRAVTDEKCTISFEPLKDRISVVVAPGDEEACRNHCGMRAWFPGDYFPEIPYCRQSRSIRDNFIRNFRAGRYQQARNILTELLGRCERFTNWQTQAEIRNDLAITEFHLGNKAACLRALEPIRIFVDDPAKTSFVLTPVDEDWGKAMMKTTRFNWKKCGGTLPVYTKDEGN